MKFETSRFGQIDVKNEEILIFPEGPLGFPDCTRFTLIQEEKAHPFSMLQSLDNANLAFVIIDPLVVRHDYHFNVTKEDLQLVKAESVDEMVVYAIVTMAAELSDVTVNLQGPLVINKKRRIGHQFVLIDSEYTTRESLVQTIENIGGTDSQQSVSSGKEEQKKAI